MEDSVIVYQDTMLGSPNQIKGNDMKTDRPLLMLDLCSGLGGASAAMLERGWRVLRVDIDPTMRPNVVADVRTWRWHGERPDLIWASPPCVEFSRTLLPWIVNAPEPDLLLILACKEIIDKACPRYWVIENVRGARRWLRSCLGDAVSHCGPYWFWGHFPPFVPTTFSGRKKESYGSKQKAQRALIPYEISKALAIAIESQMQLPMGEGIA